MGRAAGRNEQVNGDHMSASEQANAGAEPQTILIIDDEPVNAHLISQLLEGHEVIVALNGTDGLNMAVDQEPDLILLDVNMPDMLGYEVCEKLKANPVTQDIPVLFNTTMDATEDKIRGFEVGGVDYIVKPYSKEEVVARIHAHLGLRAMQKKMESRNRQLLRYKGFMELLLVERMSATHVGEGDEFRALMALLETVAELSEAHGDSPPTDGIANELNQVRGDVGTIITELGPKLRKLRKAFESYASQ